MKNIKIIAMFFLCSCFYLHAKNTCKPFKLGVETISASLFKKICPRKKACMIGLITNQTGVDQQGTATVDILVQKGCTVRYIFAPEHGLNGTLAERDVNDSLDEKRKIPIISLYGNGSGKMIAPEYMKAIDLIVFDIQDSGMRHYTYISTLLNTMKLAQEYKKPYVVLDRPNPLGARMEGPLVEPDLISFISIASIPLRHGMTIGEVATYFNKHVLKKPASLHVVPMQEYNPSFGFMGTFMHQLSPNLQSLQSCYGYSFLGLLGEVEPFDVGVGTPMAFRCITLPEAMNVDPLVWQKLQKLFTSHGVKSFVYDHINPKHNRLSKGLRLEFSEITQLGAFELCIAILQFFKKEGVLLSFSAAFNKAVGTKDVQEMINGTVAMPEFVTKTKREIDHFYQHARHSFLYKREPISSLRS